MAEHPTLAELEALLRCGLSPERLRSVVAHLSGGCARCSSVLGPRLHELDALLQADAQGGLDLSGRILTPEEDAAYDAVLDRALDAVLARRDEAEEIAATAAVRGADALGEAAFANRELCGALLRRSWELRFEDPARMVELASLAVLAAERLDPEVAGEGEIADLRCRAWAELGNAHRVANDLDEAEAAVDRASVLFAQGTGDDLLEARLWDIQASLHGARREFDRALAALDLVQAIHERRGDDHLAGRALISKGIYTGDRGQPEEAIRFLQDGLARIDQDREPGLSSIAIHNQLWFLVESGRYGEARHLLRFGRQRFDLAGGQVNRLKMSWLEGRIEAGLGKPEEGLRHLMQAYQGFEELGLGFSAALVALELGAIQLLQGRNLEARESVAAALTSFRALSIRRELVAAALLVQRAFEQGVATAAMVRSVADYLRHAEKDPVVRFQPAGR